MDSSVTGHVFAIKKNQGYIIKVLEKERGGGKTGSLISATDVYS
jgi:hypothetical protein